ncbi:hypothetical protein TNCV_4360881 [Trichonephila clavipes]|nr:hypothetical protein TNCV_4360881 [Trichonephila clavipes]
MDECTHISSTAFSDLKQHVDEQHEQLSSHYVSIHQFLEIAPFEKKINGVRFGDRNDHRTKLPTSYPATGYVISSESRTEAHKCARDPS